ncbi:MAG: HEAT repeat domain-containing protein [Pyrinomonadaceae bacterium]
MKNNYPNFFRTIAGRLTGALSLVVLLALTANAQAKPVEEGSGIMYYVFFGLVFVGLCIAFYFQRRSGQTSNNTVYNYQNRSDGYYSDGSYDMGGVDAEMELEWLRKARKSKSKRRAAGKGTETAAAPKSTIRAGIDTAIDTKEFQEKMRKLQYSQLPINSFGQLAPAKRYTPLPVSDDPSLLTAIEQVHEEFEEDEVVRDLAVRILTAFKNKNSVEALSQVALYDLSANIRSKAVATLADFDHESVFEPILLACADPTREVRAAAARGLFRLGFDRAHAWKRIIEADDKFRMSHAARAAIEADIVAKSFERLLHEDVKIAYEAFALVSLLVRSGETAPIFAALRNHKDERVKYAVLHVLKVQKDERMLVELNQLRSERSWPTDMAERLRETVNSLETVAA